jgi:hypothetical protein
MDDMYFILAPFFGGWSWEEFLDMPIDRLYKWSEQLNHKIGDMKDIVSFREIELGRAINRAFGGDGKKK